MPFTPYHLGPNTCIGLIFKRWLDLHVFIAAGLIVDFEVLVIASSVAEGYPIRYWHTLLVSGATGLGLALVMQPCRKPLRWGLKKIHLPQDVGILKSLLSGLLGAWLHVLVDGLYRTGAGLFWPLKIANPLCRFNRGQVETLCVIMLVAALGIYLGMRLWLPTGNEPTHTGQGKQS